MAESVSYADTDDVGIVIAVARYVPEALAEAYRRHAGAVFGLAQRMLWDQGTAEEMVQEVFLRLWERPERFDRLTGLTPLVPPHGHPRALRRPDPCRRAAPRP